MHAEVEGNKFQMLSKWQREYTMEHILTQLRLRNSGCGGQPEHRCQPSRAAGMYAICSMLVP